MEKEMFCYIHEGGELVKTAVGSVEYKDFTVKFDPSCLLPLHDDADIVKMFKFNDMFFRAYVFQCAKGGDGFNGPTRFGSGPYGGVLFSAIAYDANDSMFPLAFRVMSSENYEDWLWFLEKLKMVMGNKKVIIISDRHPALIRSVLEHMSKLSSMLVKHKEESNNWKGCIGIEDKVLQNIAKGEVGWQMLGIPCEHAAIVIISIGQNVTDFVNDCYKYPMQELIYGGSFFGIETHDMPSVDDDGLVRSIIGEVFFSLKPPPTKCPPGKPRKKRIES
ncbi:hypothetical protein CK203_113351 [Vitis vinifera]|uniref:MULE transposase domain-containing protein n=1 Tax=Vitis vinifera TaxID=29760 RepID=A0A438C925_VITVI|nr:hypothetical protein CK203_113351 [Vitis vinifera]